jgi:hypothetical protein
MDLLTTITACSLAKDFTLVLAMAMTFSQGNVLTVKDAAELANPPLYDPLVEQDAEQMPSTRDAALVKLARLRAVGASPVMGLIPVPPEWAAQFQRAMPELLDPCINISIGSAMVSQFEYECGPKAARACVLQRYAQAAGLEGFDGKVLATIRTNGLPAAASVVVETDEVFSTPIYEGAAAKRTWGADKIFFATSREKKASTAPSNQAKPKRQ